MHKVPQSVVISAAILGIHAGVCAVIPRFGATMTSIGTALLAAVVLTALYAPQKLSDRAFRLLSWITTDPSGHQNETGSPLHSGNSEHGICACMKLSATAPLNAKDNHN